MEVATLTFIGASAVATALFALSRKKKKSTMKRTVSFTSMGLALNSFPIEAQVPDATINAACYFEKEAPTVEAIAKQVVEPLLEYERFSHVLNMETQVFEPSKNTSYEPKDLVRELTIKGDEHLTHQTIFEHLQDVLNNEDRNDLPWWEILVVRNTGKGQSACVIRVHHALADGLALVSAFGNILTDMNGKPIQDPLATKQFRKSSQKKNIFALWLSLIEATFHVLLLGASKYDDDTAFSKSNNSKMKHNGKRDFIIFPTIPLHFVKELKTAAKCTVNDILMTAVSQAIYDYCKCQEDPLLSSKGSEIQCRALLPVGFPRSAEEMSDKTTAMSNKWCMASCDMGVGFTDISDRLKFVHSKTTEMKEKPRAYMQLKIQNTIPPLLPMSVGRQTVFDVFSRHSLVLTNVPGPDKACVFAGQPIKNVQLFFENILNQVDLLSYDGQVYGNIVYDPEALPDFGDFGRNYAKALVTLAERLDVKVPKELENL